MSVCRVVSVEVGFSKKKWESQKISAALMDFNSVNTDFTLRVCIAIFDFTWNKADQNNNDMASANGIFTHKMFE